MWIQEKATLSVLENPLTFHANCESQEPSLFDTSFRCLKAKTMIIADLPALTVWIYTFCESLKTLEGNFHGRLARNTYDYLLCVYIIMS